MFTRHDIVSNFMYPLHRNYPLISLRSCKIILLTMSVSSARIELAIITSPAGSVVKYYNVRVCMCVCACVCVCLSVCRRAYLRNTHAVLTNFFVHVAYSHGSVLLRWSDEIPRRRGSFGGFLHHWQCIVQQSIWNPYENGWTDRDAVWVKNSGGP